MPGRKSFNKILKRRTWGGVRSRIRQKFSNGDYEIGPEFLNTKDSFSYRYNGDSSRARWKLKNRVGSMKKNLSFVYCLLSGMSDTVEIEKLYGVFVPRCSLCGKKMHYRFVLVDEELVCWDCAPLEETRRGLV